MLSARSRDSSQLPPVDHATKATDDPAPSLHPRYRGFITTTGRSAGVSAQRYSRPYGGLPARALPLAAADAAVSGHAFSRSAREPQTKLTPPLRRTPPGQ